jgi:hypothetical protein
MDRSKETDFAALLSFWFDVVFFEYKIYACGVKAAFSIKGERF